MYDREFVKIYEAQKLKVYGYILYKVRSQSVAEDITSNVFLKLLKELQTNRGILDYAVPWVYRVASNEIIDHFRNSYYNKTNSESEISAKVSENQESEGDVDVFVAEYKDVLSQMAKDEQEQLVLSSLKELRAEDQEVIELRLFQELPFKEIGVILESTEAAAKMKYGRAIEKLKVICEKQNGSK